MAARGTTDAWPEAPAAAAQATVLLERLESLVREDAEVFGRALRSLEEPKGDFDLGTALDRAADVPLRIAEVAADVALLAAEVAERCDPRRRADAVAAGTLAAAAAQAAADLVAVNLTALEGDPRVARARYAAGEAARAASAVS
jgi:formiminotetrahydrofolate cyclodeaminase